MTPNKVSRLVVSEVKGSVFKEVSASTPVRGKTWRQVRGPNTRQVLPIVDILKGQLLDGDME